MKSPLKTTLFALVAVQLTACEDSAGHLLSEVLFQDPVVTEDPVETSFIEDPIEDPVILVEAPFEVAANTSLNNGFYLSGLRSRDVEAGVTLHSMDVRLFEDESKLHNFVEIDNRSAEQKAIAPHAFQSLYYNSSGQYTQRYDNISFASDTLETFSYDASQRLESNVIVEDDEVETERFYYNAQGQLTARVGGEDGVVGNEYQHTYEYNSDGTMKLMISGNPTTPPPYDTTYFFYDANGNLESSQKDLQTDGRIDSSATYTFDTHGNLIEKFEYSSSGALSITTNYEYESTTEPVHNYMLWEMAYYRQ